MKTKLKRGMYEIILWVFCGSLSVYLKTINAVDVDQSTEGDFFHVDLNAPERVVIYSNMCASN